MLDYIPLEQADIHSPSAYVYLVDERSEEIQAEQPISDAEIEVFAQTLIGVFDDGFQWSDISGLMVLCREYLDDFRMNSLHQKREAVVKILNRVIELTDTPFLPDKYTDLLFQSMTTPFVSLIIPDSIEELFPPITIEGKPTDEAIEGFLDEMVNNFKDGFQWRDLASVSKLTIRFVNQYPDLFLEEKAEIAKSILDYIIENTNTPRLPDLFSDPIFKSMAHPLIDGISSSS